MLTPASPSSVPTRPMTPGTSALVSTSIVRRGVTSTVNSPMRVMRGRAPGVATPPTVISLPSLRTVTCTACGWLERDGRRDGERDAARLGLRARVHDVESRAFDDVLDDADRGRGQQQRVGVNELAAEAQRELLDGARAAIGEQRARHRRRAARERDRAAQLVPSHFVAAGDVQRARQLAAQRARRARCAQTSTDTLRWPSAVDAPRCGVSTTLGVRAQRMVGGERLLREHVEQRAAQAVARQLGERDPSSTMMPPRARFAIDRAVGQQRELARA